jgi:hypothetical protein
MGPPWDRHEHGSAMGPEDQTQVSGLAEARHRTLEQVQVALAG